MVTDSDFRDLLELHYPVGLEPLSDVERIETLVGFAAGEYFTPLALDRSHSIIALWKEPNGREPVAWLDSEGDSWVLANSVSQLVSMLPYGPGGLYDIASCWTRFLSDGGESPLERFGQDSLDRMLREARSGGDTQGLEGWLADHGVAIDRSVVSTIGEAMKAHDPLGIWVESKR